MKVCIEPVAVAVEDGGSSGGDKDKKKNSNKRRSNRRSKQNSHLLASSYVNEVSGECSQSNENGGKINGHPASASFTLLKRPEIDMQPLDDHVPTMASNVAFISMPTMHVNEQAESLLPEAIGCQSKSCHEPIAVGGTSGSFIDQDVRPFFPFEGMAHSKIFAPHWPKDSVNEALERGAAFKAVFRVNAHNRLEAYCKIEGVPVDILINGIAAQNRAVEGDVVVIQVDPMPCWTKMKGTNGPSNNLTSTKEFNSSPEAKETVPANLKGKMKVVPEEVCTDSGNMLPSKVSHCGDSCANDTVVKKLNGNGKYSTVNWSSLSISDTLPVGSAFQRTEVENGVNRMCALISSSPLKRPTGRVVAIVERSPRRDTIVGFLNVKQWIYYKEVCKKDAPKEGSSSFTSKYENIQLTPSDPRFPKMMVLVKLLPDCIKRRIEYGDVTVEMELVAAAIDNWNDECPFPQACVSHVFGRGSEMEAQMNAILYENAICYSDFSFESLSCLPHSSWEVPLEELKSRRDLRKLCIFTIDLSTATDLDDALSFERLQNGTIRVGVHIADVSYFVLPNSSLDIEAQIRSTTVYMLQRKLPMLPPLLSENLGSLNPGVDRLVFSIFWDLNGVGDVLDRWIGRTVIRSCCKLSYDLAQGIINGSTFVNDLPPLHGHGEWSDVFSSVRGLNEVAKILREKRFNDGALRLEGSEISFLFDEYGIPYDSVVSERKESNFLVEEFMLLANRTAAEVISRAFPDTALLRRQPEPNIRKLREFEAFCSRLGFELDTSSSGQFHHSLELIRKNLKDDGVLFDILVSYATRPMQLAMYFCSGDLKDNREEWGHYALAVPLYTHFTSPLRRYSDILVHRMLAAAVDAEELYIENRRKSLKARQGKGSIKCLTGLYFDKDAAESLKGREVLSAAALKHFVLQTESLSNVAAHCNERKLASRHVRDACDKLYMWVLLKRKEVLLSEARVLGLGPRFMSVYIQQLAIERRIYYDEVEGMTVEWFETTSTLVLNFSKHRRPYRKGGPSFSRTVGEVAWVVSPCDLKLEPDYVGDGGYLCSANCSENISIPVNQLDAIWKSNIDPAVFPLTVRLLSTIPIVVHAIGGDDGPLDIGVRLFMSSYYS